MRGVAEEHVAEERGKGAVGVVILGAWYGDADAIQRAAAEGSYAVEEVEGGSVVDVTVPLRFFLRRSQLR
jgi:hypothetical protein